MRRNTEAHFSGILDRRLQRHNDRLWHHLLAWAEVLGALGWCVAVKNARGEPQLNPSARAGLQAEPRALGSWAELVAELDRTPALARPVASADVQVWATRSAPLARDPLAGPKLTPRETEVLAWLREGKTGPEIAIILGCAPRTVESHVAKIYRKLGIRTRAGLLIQPSQPK